MKLLLKWLEVLVNVVGDVVKWGVINVGLSKSDVGIILIVVKEVIVWLF